MIMTSIAYIGGFGSGFAIALTLAGLFLAIRAWIRGHDDDRRDRP